MKLRLTKDETEMLERGQLTAIGRKNSKALEASLLEAGVPIYNRPRGVPIWDKHFNPPLKVCASLAGGRSSTTLEVTCILYNYLPAKEGLKAEYRWIFEIQKRKTDSIDESPANS